MTEAPLHWNLIAIGAVAPMLLGLIAAYPFWRKDQMIFGNVVGTAIIFAFSIGLILREYAEIEAVTKGCLDQGYTCYPDSFTRFAVYATLGLVQIFTLFYVSIKVEERHRRRLYSPEWRR